MEKYLKGVNGELSYEELCSICQKEVPRGNYYSYEKIRAVLLRKLNGELTDEYFQTWLIVASWALNDGKHQDIFWTFDGCAFKQTFDRKCVLELMSRLKDYDYKLRHKKYIEQHKKDKLKVVYLRFEHCNWTEDSAVYKAFFVDYANKRFDVRFIDDAFFEFNDGILYSSIAEDSDDEEMLMADFFDETEDWIYDHSLNF